MHDQIRITVVATGFDQTKQRLQQFVISQPSKNKLIPSLRQEPPRRPSKHSKATFKATLKRRNQKKKNPKTTGHPRILKTKKLRKIHLISSILEA